MESFIRLLLIRQARLREKLIYPICQFSDMDPETARKVNQLAKNLKDLHMATTMEEAIQRAKDIIIGTPDETKSINELMTELDEEKEELKKDKEFLDEAEKDLKEIKDLEEKDDFLHEEQAERVQHIEQEIDDAEDDVELIKENIDVAEEVQEEE